MTLYASRAAADVAAERLKVYAQPQRLMILSRLLDGEHTVGEIEESTGIGQPALSQQLAELHRAEVVKPPIVQAGLLRPDQRRRRHLCSRHRSHVRRPG